jgi:hypothetical protein
VESGEWGVMEWGHQQIQGGQQIDFVGSGEWGVGSGEVEW